MVRDYPTKVRGYPIMDRGYPIMFRGAEGQRSRPTASAFLNIFRGNEACWSNLVNFRTFLT
jgi:hypothetical protein